MRTEEPQYEEFKNFFKNHSLQQLGLMTSWGWFDDPKRLAFTTSRYKFVSKMLSDKNKVLEIGCGDGFGSRIVAQTSKEVLAIDMDETLLESAKKTSHFKDYNVKFYKHNILEKPFNIKCNAAYSLDVLEHIPKKLEDDFILNIKNSLMDNSPLIIGCPSLESQEYASKLSKEGHVNCKTQPDLVKLLQKYYNNCFAFSMNDEVVHTGFSKMSNYNIILCT